MQVKLTQTIVCSLPWQKRQTIEAGTIVEASPARNLPYGDNHLWVDAPEYDCGGYGTLLEPGDYEIL